MTSDAIVAVSQGQAVITKVRLVAGKRHIVRMDLLVRGEEVFAVFSAFGIKALLAVFTFIQVVSAYILILYPKVRREDGFGLFRIFQPLYALLYCLMRKREEGFEFLFVFGFGVLLIEKVIFLVPQVYTPKTVATTATVMQKVAIGAVGALRAEMGIVTVHTVQTVTAPFTSEDIQIIYTVPTVPDDMSIQAVLVPDASKHQIAIP